MPIKVDINNNSSHVRVRPISQDEVRVKPKDNQTVIIKPETTTEQVNTRAGTDILIIQRDKKIEAEKKERIEADDKLNQQKQDKIKFIEVYDLQGVIDPANLSLLNNSLVNQILYNHTYYKLVFKDGQVRKYFTASQATVYNEIDIDMATGYYRIIQKVDPALQEH